MLNISPHSISFRLDRRLFPALRRAEGRRSGKVFIRLSAILSGLIIITLCLPWTQNIRARGQVSTLRPDQRPQTINSVIAGRIEKWYVQEGDYVKQGDTILFISEVKDEYFDPQLLTRTGEQLQSKEMSVRSYQEKVKALEYQVDALEEAGKLHLQQMQNKLLQSRLKVTSDSIDYEAKRINFHIATEQFNRMEQLQRDGLKSLTDLENRRLSLQKAQAEMISAENQLLGSKNEVLNAEVQLTLIRAQYREKMTKAESEKYAALSTMYDSEAMVTRLRNQYMNYSVRRGMHYITAPRKDMLPKRSGRAWERPSGKGKRSSVSCLPAMI